MTEWLVGHFIKNKDDVQNEQVRLAYGNLSSITGIVCNVFLFVLKFLIGLLSNSIAIISDAFNNLSDCLSCLVTMFGYHLAAKPADQEHPFGHGRMEYIVSFFVSGVILIVGFELFRSSITKIIHPEEVHFSWMMVIILAASILVKVWMGSFNKTLGKRINNIAMIATSQDSMNDVFATSATLAALILSAWIPSIPFDGIAGLVVSLFIFCSGYGIAKEIIDKLLGGPASHELTEKIRTLILSHPEIIGVHDMMIHDYGPGRQFGSAHAEVESSMDFLKAHDVIDQAEREVYEKTHVFMTLHMDPIDISDPQTNAYREEVMHILHSIDPKLSMHDFRVVYGQTHTNLVFDVVIPFGCTHSSQEITDRINSALSNQVQKLYTVITFDHEFTSDADQEDL